MEEMIVVFNSFPPVISFILYCCAFLLGLSVVGAIFTILAWLCIIAFYSYVAYKSKK